MSGQPNKLRAWWWSRGEDWYVFWGSGVKRGHWRYALSTIACSWGLHRAEFSDSAIPASYDPPEPPEAGWACRWCGQLREPRHWRFLKPWWSLKARFYEWRYRDA
jgi:hypothetical protein